MSANPLKKPENPCLLILSTIRIAQESCFLFRLSVPTMGIGHVDLQEVQTEDIRAYLLHHGWRAVDAVRGPLSAPRQPDPRVAYFFHDETEAVLMLPISTGLSDFYPRLREAIERLANVEGRSAYDVVQEFLLEETKRSLPSTRPDDKRGEAWSVIGAYTTCSLGITHWSSAELQTYRGYYILKQTNETRGTRERETLYIPCHHVNEPLDAQYIFTCPQETVLLRACEEEDQGWLVLFGNEQAAKQYLDMHSAQKRSSMRGERAQ